MNKFYTILIALSIIIPIKSYSQSLSPSVVSSAGSHAQNENLSISWTLGEPVIKTFINDNTTLTQGFHQPFITSSTPSSIWSSGELNIEVFPNPTQNKLYIYLDQMEERTFQLELYNLKGQIIQIKNLNNKNNALNISHLPPGNYIIRIISPQGYKTFKIIKQ